MMMSYTRYRRERYYAAAIDYASGVAILLPPCLYARAEAAGY